MEKQVRSTSLENQMENNLEHEVETRLLQGVHRDTVLNGKAGANC